MGQALSHGDQRSGRGRARTASTAKAPGWVDGDRAALLPRLPAQRAVHQEVPSPLPGYVWPAGSPRLCPVEGSAAAPQPAEVRRLGRPTPPVPGRLTMGSNRYVRLNLTATQNHIPDPAIEVEVWLDRLEELLACWGPKPDPLDCYDLLALWARLQRTRPDLLAQLEGNQELAGAETLLAERDPELARLALTVPDPPTWREETRALEASYEELIDPVERSTLAENLLTDLDDAELVLHSARRHGVDDPQLDKELQVCRTWLMRHADLFLAASVFVQAVGMTFRPELADEDYDLALTALKYERILDAAEEAEAELAFVGLTPFNPSVLKALAQQYQQKAEKSTLVPAAAPEPGPRIL